MDNIQDEYWDIPRFKDSPSEEAKPTQATTGAYITKWDPLQRSYEDQKWYFIVLYPLNTKGYDQDPSIKQYYDHYAVEKGRKWISTKAESYYVTREVEANRTHVNILCSSVTDLSCYHGKKCYSKNKYRIDVSPLKDMGDRLRVYEYINKERSLRSFKLYLDYYMTK